MKQQLKAAQERLAKLAPISGDVISEECGCVVEKRNYSNPFHRVYFRVKRCERHSEKNIATIQERLAEAERLLGGHDLDAVGEYFAKHSKERGNV